MMEYEDSTMNDFVDSALSDATATTDDAMADAITPVEIETFN